MAQLIDVFPTLIELTGGVAPSNLSGRSLKGCLSGTEDATPDRTIFTSAAYGRINFGKLQEGADETPLHTRALQFAMNPKHRTSMARTREWKIVLNEEGPPELYHMNGRKVERGNVAGLKEHADVRRVMEKRLAQWWKW